MHVLQLGPVPPPEGGVNRNLLAIRDELAAAGDACSIIATMRSSNIVPEDNVYHPNGPAELVRLIRQLKYDILHLHIGGELPPRVIGLIGVCTFFGRGKTVLTFHSGGYPLTEAGKSAGKNSLRGAVFRKFDRIIAVNPLIAEMFERFGVEKQKIRVILPFVQRSPDKTVEIPAHFKEFTEKHKPFLLTVGLLEPVYDLPLQINAMEKILEKFPEAGLLIAGSGPLESELKQLIAQKNYAGNILLAGDVEHPVTLHLINNADILLRTTLYDGDAIAIREALHLETPVIATDNGMRPDGIRLIPLQNAEALMEAVSETLATGEKKAKKAKKDDRTNITAVLELYREILER